MGSHSPDKRAVSGRNDDEGTMEGEEDGMDVEISPASFTAAPPTMTMMPQGMRAEEDELGARVVSGPRNQYETTVTTRSPSTIAMYDGNGRPVSILMAAMKDKNTQMDWNALPPRPRRHGAAIHR